MSKHLPFCSSLIGWLSTLGRRTWEFGDTGKTNLNGHHQIDAGGCHDGDGFRGLSTSGEGSPLQMTSLSF